MVKPADDAANGMKHLGQRFGLAEVAVPIVTSRPHTAGCDALRRVCARPGGNAPPTRRVPPRCARLPLVPLLAPSGSAAGLLSPCQHRCNAWLLGGRFMGLVRNPLYLLTLPVFVIAIFARRAINKRFHTHAFITCMHVGLMVIGAALLWRAST